MFVILLQEKPWEADWANLVNPDRVTKEGRREASKLIKSWQNHT